MTHTQYSPSCGRTQEKSHRRTPPQQSVHSVWHTPPLPQNLTQISHLLMTVTNAYWLHWMTYILSRCRLLSHTLSPTLNRNADCFHMTLFLWLRLTRWTREGWKERLCAVCFLLSFTCPHAHTLTQTRSAQHLDLEGNNTTLCSEVQYVHMCILKKKLFCVAQTCLWLMCKMGGSGELKLFIFPFRHIRPPVM